MTHILEPLNKEQREAVAAPDGHYLVLAGAGSGKTRVLVHRIAWLMEAQQVSPYAILAVTFTNKAAGEMRARIESLGGFPLGSMWIGTFHGLCHRLLRMHWQEAHLPEAFQIIDSDDQLRIIKRIVKQLKIDDKYYPPRQAQYFINNQKDAARRAADVEDQGDLTTATYLNVYRLYEETCQRSGLVDFAELLLRVYELFRDVESIRAHYQNRFKHVLVDEFQDTNTIQYAWLKLLCGDKACFFAVGDDDQSIYGWRGAKVENVEHLTRDYPTAEVIRLEQNYRSTGTILRAANAVIHYNEARLGKELWTEQGDGEPILSYAAFNEIDEARFIVDRIQRAHTAGTRLRDMAILYRSNAQSRVLEDALLQAEVPYRIYGGVRFFERAEIKDALAYLRLSQNRADDASFERIINTPTRGVGERTVALIRDDARMAGISLWEAMQALLASGELTARTRNALSSFADRLSAMTSHIKELPLYEQVDTIIQMSGLIEHYKKEPGEKGQARIENLAELVSAARVFDKAPDESLSMLDAFLAHAALEAGETQADAFEDYVHMMTMHSAKGLEFSMVCLCGMEEGLFPHMRSIEDAHRLEEERRLCYVGITRAMDRLLLTYAEKRRLRGQEAYHRPSRFLKEIPPELIQEERIKSTVIRPKRSTSSFGYAMSESSRGVGGFSVGQRVQHAKFGTGVILNYEGQGAHARVQVNFDGAGSKWLALEYANLEAD